MHTSSPCGDDDVLGTFRAAVSVSACMYVRASAAAAAATEHQLNELTRATIGRLQPFLVARGQGVVYDWNARNLETQQPEEPPPSLWPAVLDVLQLAADTQRDALQCFDLFGAPLARLLEERVQLVQRYRELQQQGPPVGGVGSGGSSSCAPVGEGVINVAAAKTLEAVAGPLITSGVVLRALAANLERYQVGSQAAPNKLKILPLHVCFGALALFFSGLCTADAAG